MKLSRRQTVAFSLVLLASACAKTPDQLQSDVNLIASGLSGIVGVLRNFPQIPIDVLTKAESYIADIKSNAALIGSAISSNADVVKTITNAVLALQGLLAPFFPIAPIVGMLVQAAIALLPGIMALVGQVMPKAAAPAGGLPVPSPEQARKTLAQGTK